MSQLITWSVLLLYSCKYLPTSFDTRVFNVQLLIAHILIYEAPHVLFHTKRFSHDKVEKIFPWQSENDFPIAMWKNFHCWVSYYLKKNSLFRPLFYFIVEDVGAC